MVAHIADTREKVVLLEEHIKSAINPVSTTGFQDLSKKF